MKKILLNILILLSGVMQAQNWVWQNPLPQGNNLNFIFALNSDAAFAAGTNGALLKTNDGGENWQIISLNTSIELRSGYFFDEHKGYIVGDDGIMIKYINEAINIIEPVTHDNFHSITFLDELNGFVAGSNGCLLRTTDGGENWFKISLQVNKSFSEIKFLNSSTGFITSNDGTLLKTTDAGNSWTEVLSDFNNNILTSIYFINSTTGWIGDWMGTFYKTTDAGDSWEIKSSPVECRINSIYFFDDNNGIAVASPGYMLITDNGGESWSVDSSGILFSLNSISFSGGSGWIAGQNGLILKSSNKGHTWNFQSDGSVVNFNSVRFINSNVGIVVGDKGVILKTTNSGASWFKVESQTTKNLNDINFFFRTPGDLYAVGDSGAVTISSDTGATWNFITLKPPYHFNLKSVSVIKWSILAVGTNGTLAGALPESKYSWTNSSSSARPDLNSVHIFNLKKHMYVGDEGFAEIIGGLGVYTPVFNAEVGKLKSIFFYNLYRGWLVGESGVILRTTNGGTKWEASYDVNVNELNSVFFINENLGYTAGTNGSIYNSTDGGITWTKQFSRITNTINKIYFPDANNGWAVGRNGTILKYSASQKIVTSTEINTTVPGKFVLYQNYPNPFNPTTKIKYIIPEHAFTNLTVFDILGNDVASLVNEVKERGEYEVDFDGSNLPSGVYFYKLSAGNFSTVKKLVLIR